MTNIWFTSDTHFGHKNIIKYCDRPFSNVEEMNEALVDNWNKIVNQDDTIYHLGDFSFMNREKTEEIFNKLNGEKHLIKGNHDSNNTLKLPWKSVRESYKLYMSFRKYNYIYMRHYPEDNMRGYAIYLHGHTHGNDHRGIYRSIPNRIDIGVDNFEYTPVNIEEIKCLVQ